MRLLNIILITLLACLYSCVTANPQAPGKPYNFCSCGPTIDADGKAYCAIWGDTKNPATAAKVFASDQRQSCEPSDCSQLFSRFCQRIQMSSLVKPSIQPPASSCYCDTVLLENDRGQIQLNCAAWADDSKNLIEYYALDDCSPQRCLEAPFNLAPQVCNRNFKEFYPPLFNRR